MRDPNLHQAHISMSWLSHTACHCRKYHWWHFLVWQQQKQSLHHLYISKRNSVYRSHCMPYESINSKDSFFIVIRGHRKAGGTVARRTHCYASCIMLWPTGCHAHHRISTNMTQSGKSIYYCLLQLAYSFSELRSKPSRSQRALMFTKIKGQTHISISCHLSIPNLALPAPSIR